MTIARELVTILRYQLDKSGLSQYQRQATTAIGGIQKRVKAVGVGARDAFHGFNLGIRDGIREHRALNAVQTKAVANTKAMAAGYHQVGGYLRTMIAALGVMSSARITDEWAGARARISLVVDDGELQNTLDSIYRISQQAGQEYTSTADLFQKVARNQRDLGLSTAESLALTESIGKAMTIGGGSNAAQAAALTQLGQALGSGVLRGDELNSIIEQSPRLAEAIATSFGVSVGKLKDLGKQGKLTSKELARGLLKQAELLNAEFEKMPKTFGRGMTLMRNAYGRFVDSLNRATRASETFYSISKLIAENMAEIVKIGAFVLLASAMTRLRTVAIGALAPFLRMAALLAGIYLIGEDMLVWSRGGHSMFGEMFGEKGEWQGTIDLIKYTLTFIKDRLGGIDQTLGLWLMKWGAIAVAGYAILSLSLGLGRVLWLLLAPVRLLGRAFWWIAAMAVPLLARAVLALPFAGMLAMLGKAASAIRWIAIVGIPAIGRALLATPAGRFLSAIALAVLALKWIYDNADKIGAKLESAFTGALEKIGIKVDGLKEKFANLIPEPVKDILGNVIGKDVDALGGTNRESIDKLFGVKPGAMQKPQSYSPSQSNQITNETHIHAQTNSPAALANAAGAAVGRATERAVSRPSWGSPNVEAMA